MSTAALRGQHLHVDAASGAAGDMMLGALLDLGVPLEVVAAALDAIGAGRDRLQLRRVVKGGIAAVDVRVDTSGSLDGHRLDHHHDLGHGATPDHGHGHRVAPDHGHGHRVAPDHGHTHDDDHDHDHGHTHDDDHGHGHDHGHDHDHDPGDADRAPRARAHAHYHYGALRERIATAALAEGVRQRAIDIFDRIARAEARLHGTTVERVAFHEVGAIDSVVDIVGTAAALDWLAPSAVTCTAVAMGHGTLRCAHGLLPVPAPAALEVLREAGGVMADGGLARELCTPTGAAILASAVTAWQPAPTGRPLGVGWGAGDADLRDRANVLRVTALAPVAEEAAVVWQVEANVDDMSPELCGPAMDAVLTAGAVDAWWTPIAMKKARPALLLSALVPAGAREPVIAAILRETTTIGVRYAPRERVTLRRRTLEVATRYGPIAVKVAEDASGVRNFAPEHEACRAAARAHGAPLKLVYAAAIAAADAALHPRSA
jgi:hypothetical protein